MADFLPYLVFSSLRVARRGFISFQSTAIRFVSASAFAPSWVEMVHLLNIKCIHFRVNVNILASTIVPVRPTAVQVPNLALTWHETGNSEGKGWSVQPNRSRSPFQRSQKYLAFFLIFLFFIHALSQYNILNNCFYMLWSINLFYWGVCTTVIFVCQN